jgi:hypothetical protein
MREWGPVLAAALLWIVIALTAVPAALAANDCDLRIEPSPAHVGDTATITATGFTPSGTGTIDEDDPVVPLLTLIGDNLVDFDSSGSFVMTFKVESPLIGRRVVTFVDDATQCTATFTWTVSGVPDTSTQPSLEQPPGPYWLAIMAGLVGLGLAYRRLGYRRS